jgi:hypothetical protein
MPVSFAVLECESEGPKPPCAGGGSRLNKGLAWWRPLPAPLCFGGGTTNGGNGLPHHLAA